MRKVQTARRFIKKHAIIIVTLCVLLAVTGGFIGWYSTIKNQEIVKNNQLAAQSAHDAKDYAQQAAAKKAAIEKAKREAAAKQLAEDAKNGTTSASDAALCNTATTHNNPASIDVVVNKQHCMQPLDYVPGDLVTSHGATLSAKAITAFNQMYDAATAAGQPFYVTSSYRSYSDQVSTYAYWVHTSGQAGADTYSARPGYSEHQTGFAFDVAANGCVLDCFGNTSQYQWFQQHASDYGFIQRYYAGSESITGYEAEEWHYRYVGIAVAKDMKAKGIKTLEQYWNITGGDY